MNGLLRVLSMIVLSAALIGAQTPALRVVVIEGEDAVNIIQQKTAVRPVVEVRDRNNLPVPGALVTFSIQGGQAATFGGASTLTVATNAAGQAAVTSLTPSAAGAFQIQVSAAFQGQVATATIAQTNVLTAAQAAAAAGANGASSASGAAGGAGGGGLSATTIGVVGAAVAGGAVAAAQVAGGGDSAPEQSHYAGAFTGNTTETLVNRGTGQTCVITRAVNATAELELDPNEPNNVAGNLSINGTSIVTAASSGCGGVGQTLPFGGGTSVSGTQAVLRGSTSTPSSNPGTNGETISTTLTVSFDGAVSGNTVTGTLKRESKQTVTSANGTTDNLQTGTFSLTLTKS